MKKKTTKKTTNKPTIKELNKIIMDKAGDLKLLPGVSVFLPGKFKWGVARVVDGKKGEIIAKFLGPIDAAKFMSVMNK